MKVYKLEVLVLDLNEQGLQFKPGDSEDLRCAEFVSVMRVQERDIAWDDDHPLNRRDTALAAFDDMFDTKTERSP